MVKRLGIALGAGAASALLFIVSATASFAAVALAYLTPLPVIIVAMGFGHLAGGVAALVAGSAVALALGWLPGLVYLGVLGFPAWYLAYLALLARTAAPGAPGAPAPPVEWYPISNLLIWVALLSAAPVLAVGAVVLAHFGGFHEAIDGLSRHLQNAFGTATLPGGFSFASLVRVAPIAMTASTFAMLAFNLWLGARVVLLSQLLTRPWPNLPDVVKLPRSGVAAFGAALAGAFLPDPVGLAAAVCAAALGMAFAFAGLSAAHVLTRGLIARRPILGAIYATIFLLMPWPMLALAVLGCLDSIIALRGQPSVLPPSPHSRS